MRSGPDHITYGALALRPGGSGVQTYAREILRAIPDQLGTTRLSAVVQRDAVAELPSAVDVRCRPVADGALRAMIGALPVRGCDLFHSLDVDLPTSTGGAATVATVHDLSVLDVPWASGRFRALGESVLVRNALRRADGLIAVSSFTAERIEALTGRTAYVALLAPAPWARVPSPDETSAVKKKYGLPDRFILQVGTVEPRKDVQLVSDVADRLDIPCVLAGAGSTGPDAPTGTRGIGYVATADLPALYNAATVTAYASRYEGFGLPPIEAMACGGAVVASAVGALPEVVGDGAVLVHRLSADHWCRAAAPFVGDPSARAALVNRGVAAARALSWQDTAKITANVYRSVLRGRG